MHLAVFIALAQIAIPSPRGYVNDFAGVLDSESIRHMEAVITEVRDKTRGEIAVVTLQDIGDRAPSDVALLIGRQWGVGAKAEVEVPTEITALMEAREAARKARDFKTSDSLRDELKSKGWIIEDTPKGPRLKHL